MNISFLKIFKGLAWLAKHGPCMANYTLVQKTLCAAKRYYRHNKWQVSTRHQSQQKAAKEIIPMKARRQMMKHRDDERVKLARADTQGI